MTSEIDHPSGKSAPLVTFAMITYNQQRYVRDAVMSALAQQCDPLEIILSDDCSSDETFDIMKAAVSGYHGPHTIVLRQEPVNRGLIAHLNTVVKMARGDYVVIAAGDDLSNPDRVGALSQKMKDQPLLIHSGFDVIDENGNPMQIEPPDEALRSGNLGKIAGARALYVGATGCWHRDLLAKFGPMEYAEAYEDLIMGYRAALEGRIAYVDRPLIRYRVGSGITTRHEDTRARNIRACRAMIAAFDQRLADTRRHYPDRHDLIAIIEKERLRDSAVVAWYSDPSEFIRRYSWRPAVQRYFVSVAFARIRRRFFHR